jgi:hypothetical protein
LGLRELIFCFLCVVPNALVAYAQIKQGKSLPQPLDRFHNGGQGANERVVDGRLIAPQAAKEAGPATRVGVFRACTIKGSTSSLERLNRLDLW